MNGEGDSPTSLTPGKRRENMRDGRPSVSERQSGHCDEDKNVRSRRKTNISSPIILSVAQLENGLTSSAVSWLCNTFFRNFIHSYQVRDSAAAFVFKYTFLNIKYS
jgi:hypothetical protein